MKHIATIVTMMTLFTFTPFSPSAQAGPEPFIGEMMMFAGNFCPRGWTDASGQLLAVNQYQALYSLLGTTYGGDGRTNFGLPDMRGRAPIHTGQGPGLTNRTLGSKSGTETEALSVSQMPAHTHSLNASNISSTSKTPGGNIQAKTQRNSYTSAGSGGLIQMAPQSLGSVGNGQPQNNMQPYLTVRFCIALEGMYPSRN